MSTEMDEVLTPELGSNEASEKMLSTTQVNDIVKREKARAAEKARLEYENRSQSEGSMQTGNGQQKGGLDMTSLKQEIINELVEEGNRLREEAEQAQQYEQLRNLADQYHHKVKKGSELFDDFNEVMADFEPGAFPALVRLAAPMENMSEIMYELTKNPTKLVEINTLAQTSPKLAQKQLEKLSASVGKNLEAKATSVSAPVPLSKIKPSSVGADNGKMTLRDLKKQDWLRG